VKIHIEKYRNINELDYEIDDGKVNFLFGVCGTGKSSILHAISSSIKPSDTTVGCEHDETVVFVDGFSPDPSTVRLYGFERQAALFEKSASGEHYEIFIGRDDVLLQLEGEFNQSIKNLREKLDVLYSFRGKVQDLQRAIGNIGAKGTFTPSSKFGKLKSAIKSAKPYAKAIIEEHGLKFAEWRNQGFTINDSYDNGQCPFCDQKLSSELKSGLDELKGLELKDIKPLFTSSTLMKDLKILEPDFTKQEEVYKTEREIASVYKTCSEIDKIIQFCNISRDAVLLKNGLNDLIIDEIVYIYFPELKEIIENVNKRSAALKAMVGKMKATFKALIDSSSKELNNQLTSLGIPYFFTVRDTDRASRTVSYVLKHKESSLDEDMRDSLSTGERILIALLLFLYRKERDIILIDDPASSYDDYRRSQIFRSIMNNENKTILVVSHDQAFIKRAVKERNANTRIGKIQMLSYCSDKPLLLDITYDSFGNLDDFIKHRIMAANTYYQKTINFRLYCDIHKSEVGEIIWGYSSAVLHGLPKGEIEESLNNVGRTEENLLKEIEGKLGIEMEPVTKLHDPNVTDSLSDFEKLICIREGLKKKRGEGLMSIAPKWYRDSAKSGTAILP
jgi:ABC-type lipoprotein export system ATPase subunit